MDTIGNPFAVRASHRTQPPIGPEQTGAAQKRRRRRGRSSRGECRPVREQVRIDDERRERKRRRLDSIEQEQHELDRHLQQALLAQTARRELGQVGHSHLHGQIRNCAQVSITIFYIPHSYTIPTNSLSVI